MQLKYFLEYRLFFVDMEKYRESTQYALIDNLGSSFFAEKAGNTHYKADNTLLL